MAEDQTEEVFEESFLQPEEEYVAEEAIVYDNDFEEVKEDQLVEGIKEEEIEADVEEEQVEELVAEEEIAEVEEEFEEEPEDVEEEVEMEEEDEDDEDDEEEDDDSDEKEMVVDDTGKDDNSMDGGESGSDSCNNESELPSDSSFKESLKPILNEDSSQHPGELVDTKPQISIKLEASGAMGDNIMDSKLDDQSELENLNRQPESWAHFTGLKVKHFTQSELEAFKKPFGFGWRREVVLRGTVTNSGKKIGDVYYFSPDKKIKLRSYVEMGLYLKKHPDCQLEPENFTFARQPIYKAPEEIIRYAQQRGGHSQPQMSVVESLPTQSPVRTPVISSVHPLPRSSSNRSTNSASDSGAEDKYGLMSVAEGRAKRKRNAPTRFEDEDYSEQSPFKKKPKCEKPGGSFPTVSQPPVSVSQPKIAHMKVALSSRSSLLANPTFPRKVQSHGQTILQLHPQPSQHLIVTGMSQLSAAVAEERAKNCKPVQEFQERESPTPKPQEKPTTEPEEPTEEAKLQPEQCVSSPPQTANSCPSSVSSSSSLKKSVSSSGASKVPVLRIKMGSFKPIKPKPADQDTVPFEKATSEEFPRNQLPHPTAPCSIMCNGRRGQLPSLLCSRCLCLFHPECVPTGIHLKEPHQFVCPNCIQPADKENQVTSVHSMVVNGNAAGDGDLTTEAEPMSKSLLNKLPTSSANFSTNSQRSRHYQPILPRPHNSVQHQVVTQTNHGQSQLQLIHQFQQQQRHQRQQLQEQLLQQSDHEHSRKIAHVSCSAANVKLPAGTQLYRLCSNSSSSKYHHDFPSRTRVTNGPIRDNRKGARKSVSQPMGRHFPPSRLSTPRSSYESALIAPIAPMKVTSAHVSSIMHHQKPKKECTEYLSRLDLGLSKLTAGYTCLNEIMMHLTARDLVKLKQVNRLFNKLASQSFLWQKVVLKGMKISDWQYLGRCIVEPFAATELDFENIRCMPNQDLCETWRNFASIVDYLKSVKRLKFGSIPTFVIDEVVNAAVTENFYNSFSNLESLVARHIFEEEAKSSQCHLDFMEQLNHLPRLQYLHLECRHGFVGNDQTANLLSDVFSALTSLKTLIMPCIKGLTAEQFTFLTKLKSVEHLEIGSCESWTSCEEESYPKSPSNSDAVETTELKGAFKYLSELTQLRNLKMTDVIIDQTSKQLSLALQRLANLTTLSLDSVTISPDATETLSFLCETVKSHLTNLREFRVFTDDPHTNKCIFELLKKLNNLKSITWKVRALVEDSGECFVPFLKERNEESEMDDLTNPDGNLDMMDVTCLNEILQNELPNTHLRILPQ